ncbi:branched-chain amino acid transport system permease protein [Sulfitobacter undariae]|uniref:Branched-chain amino acid transport system permease protein n=1 Tax=Sulfitobacter undariae TaxID=1563671 RepID=A0A7W6E9X4_9RHOB|nr:branched-chain amino acid ABC transporter permease [Sulfitobacter undariae]MBB3994408.1 branched-chain amino acid transport system permease protein [Sulfitobacter undariae]
MFYREAGDFNTTYAEDQQTFPIKFDRYRYYLVMFIAIVVVPFVINDYWVNSLLLPFLIYSIAALGLNILVGYCGQVSLGTGGFMAVGAYSCYKFMTGVDIWWGGELLFRLPEFNIFFSVIMGGVMTAIVGALFGLPSLRIKGFYLAVATLAAQFFLVWLFNRVAWFYNYSASGQISAPERGFLGVLITGPSTAPWAAYLFCLFFTIICAYAARNMTRGAAGRKWMAIRDMDIAAEIIGVNPLRAKLTAFAVSSFFIGISGALFFAVYLGAVEVGEAFGITKSFLVLFMVIIGGLGSIFGSFAGAAFLVLLPVALKVVGVDFLGWPTDIVAHLQLVIVGALIILFLIVEPHGIAQLWRLAKEKLRLWPFPH